MKIININKQLNLKNKTINIKYNGTSKKNINLDKIEALIEGYINNQKFIDMVETVTEIKTLLKSCKTDSLMICYQDEEKKETVKYDNSKLILYEKEEIIEKNDFKYQVKYEPLDGVKINHNIKELNKINDIDIEIILGKIYYTLNQIYDLKQVTLNKEVYDIHEEGYNINGKMVNLDYKGTPKNESIDLDRIKTIIHDFINDKCHNKINLLEIITSLRTILTNFEENLLAFCYETPDLYEDVWYIDSKLTTYNITKGKNRSEFDGLISYKEKNIIDINYTNYTYKALPLEDHSHLDLAAEISNMIEQFYNLKNNTSDRNNNTTLDTLLIEMQKLLKNEKSSKKIQTILSIFESFHTIVRKDDDLYEIILELFESKEHEETSFISLLDMNDYISDDTVLIEEDKDLIKIIGDCIIEAFQNETNRDIIKYIYYKEDAKQTSNKFRVLVDYIKHTKYVDNIEKDDEKTLKKELR